MTLNSDVVSWADRRVDAREFHSLVGVWGSNGIFQSTNKNSHFKWTLDSSEEHETKRIPWVCLLSWLTFLHGKHCESGACSHSTHTPTHNSTQQKLNYVISMSHHRRRRRRQWLDIHIFIFPIKVSGRSPLCPLSPSHAQHTPPIVYSAITIK